MSKKLRGEVAGLRTWWKKGRKPVSLRPGQAAPRLTSARGWKGGLPVLSHSSFALWQDFSPYIKGNFSYYFSYIILTCIWGRWILFIYNKGDSGSCTLEKLHWFSQPLPVYSRWRFSPTLVIQESLNNFKKKKNNTIVIFHCNIEYTRLNLYIALAHVQQTMLIFSSCSL